MQIIGREYERELLRSYYEAEEPDFLVVYGRRRVGKTFLLREHFDDNFCFHATGLAKGSKKDQLEEFNRALNRYGKHPYPLADTWLEAFSQLRQLVESSSIVGKKVIFLDEMPWMDTHRSRFITGLEAFWNGWASGRPEILLIVCGSSAAWITRKLFEDTEGLYNRVTRRMLLKPFTLRECEQFYQTRGILLSRQQMLESYMILGGIPFYLRLMEQRFGLSQNIDRLFFTEAAPLKNEFKELYHSIFKHPDNHMRIVEAIGTKGCGLGREEIIEATRISDGGGLTKSLYELELSGFIRKYYGYGKTEKHALYQLIDPFSHYYLRFMRGANAAHDEHFWTNNEGTPALNTWKGYAFEQVCLLHVPQIKAKLGIAGVATNTYSWRSAARKDDTSVPGAQIDLVIERRDNTFNLCEIKFSNREFEIDKDYDEKLLRKRWAFEDVIGKSKTVHITFITTYGVKRNKYWSSSVQSEVLMDDLFT